MTIWDSGATISQAPLGCCQESAPYGCRPEVPGSGWLPAPSPCRHYLHSPPRASHSEAAFLFKASKSNSAAAVDFFFFLIKSHPCWVISHLINLESVIRSLNEGVRSHHVHKVPPTQVRGSYGAFAAGAGILGTILESDSCSLGSRNCCPGNKSRFWFFSKACLV